MKTLAPLYSWHGDVVLQERVASMRAGDIGVLNPSNGPTPDDEAERAGVLRTIAAMRRRSVVPFGYVALGYGERSIKEVLSDCETWSTAYGIKSLFFDEADRLSWEALRIVRNLAGSTAGAKARAILNVGREAHSGRWLIDDLVVSYEGAWLTLSAPVTRGRVAIVHSTPKEQHLATWDRLQRLGYEYCYITDDVLPNPFDARGFVG